MSLIVGQLVLDRKDLQESCSDFQAVVLSEVIEQMADIRQARTGERSPSFIIISEDDPKIAEVLKLMDECKC